MEWMLLVKLFSTLLAILGMIAIVLGLPGTLLAWLGVLVYSLATRLAETSGWTLLATLVGCLLFEIADNLLSGVMVKRFGASKGSILMAWLGGLVGAMIGGSVGGLGGFLGSAVLGVFGAFAGSYAAVYFWEQKRHNRPNYEASRAAFGTVLGRLLGMAVKLVWVVWLLSLVW